MTDEDEQIDMNELAEDYDKQEELRNSIGGDTPILEDKQTLYGLFKFIIRTKDTTKVGNCDDEEIRSVREYKMIKNYAEKMGLNEVAEFITTDCESILGTSLSKNKAYL